MLRVVVIPHVPAGRGSLRIPAHVNSTRGLSSQERSQQGVIRERRKLGTGGHLLPALGTRRGGTRRDRGGGHVASRLHGAVVRAPSRPPRGWGFVRVAAARDLGLGLSALTMLKLGMRRPLGILWATGAVIPALDATLVRLEGGKPWQVAQHAASSMILLALGSAMLRQQDD
nr:DUF4267 domain-containing protein [Rubrobacter naiadicus]